MSGLQFIRLQSTGLSDLGGGECWSLYKLQPKLKNSSQVYKCTLADLVCLPEKAIDNAVKDNRNLLQACVSAGGGNFEHVMLQFV